MSAERFVVRIARDGHGCELDGPWQLIDTRDGKVIGEDGGEPEDQLLVRDWSWVAPALNRVAQESAAELAAARAERDELRRQMTAASEVTDRLMADLDQLRRHYLDVADALLPRSSGPADLVAEARRLRQAEQAASELRRAERELTDARDRAQTIVDEQVGPEPIRPLDELLSILERHIFEARRDRTNGAAELERLRRLEAAVLARWDAEDGSRSAGIAATDLAHAIDEARAARAPAASGGGR